VSLTVSKTVRVTLDVVIQIAGDVSPGLVPWGDFSDEERAAQYTDAVKSAQEAAAKFVAEDCFGTLNFDIFRSCAKTDYGRLIRLDAKPIGAKILESTPC